MDYLANLYCYLQAYRQEAYMHAMLSIFTVKVNTFCSTTYLCFFKLSIIICLDICFSFMKWHVYFWRYNLSKEKSSERFRLIGWVMSPNIRPEGHRQRTSSAPLMFIDGDSAFVRANKALGENEMDQKCAFYTFFPQK